MAISLWKPEIEKKYCLSGSADAKRLADRAENLGLLQHKYVLQKDWIPDFKGFPMRAHNVLLRIRTETSLTGQDTNWVVTIKQRSTIDDVHHNMELEASASDQGAVQEMNAFIHDSFGVQLDIVKLAKVDLSYAKKIGLTEHRIYLEKKRREFASTGYDIVLAIDELPDPAGWFAELELKDVDSFNAWESQLALANTRIETRDYGEIVKDITKILPVDKQRHLAF